MDDIGQEHQEHRREGHELAIVVGTTSNDRVVIRTGLRGLVQDDGSFFLPFRDTMAAEEIGRIVTGQVRTARGS